MELLSKERRNTKANYPLPITQDTPEKVDLFFLLTRIFSLNEEERFRAGIYIGYEGQRWISQAGLVLPLLDEEEYSLNAISPGENK